MASGLLHDNKVALDIQQLPDIKPKEQNLCEGLLIVRVLFQRCFIGISHLQGNSGCVVGQRGMVKNVWQPDKARVSVTPNLLLLQLIRRVNVDTGFLQGLYVQPLTNRLLSRAGTTAEYCSPVLYTINN